MNQNQALAIEIRKAINEIDKQIEIMDAYASAGINMSGEPRTAQHLMTKNGEFSVNRLLQAKANLLLAMATLRAGDR